MHLSHLDSLFWLLGLVGHLALLFVLLFRRRARRFPLFTAFVFCSVLSTVVLYLIYPSGSRRAYPYAYFYTYWGFVALNLVLQLGVVYEVASCVFRPLGGWAVDVRRRLIGLILLSVCVAIALAWLSSPRAYEWREALVMRGSLFSAALFAELFVGMTAHSVTAGLPWKTHAARIIQGLGIYSIFCIVVEAANSYFGLANGTTASMTMTRARMLLYLLCLAYWIMTLWRPEPKPEHPPDGIQSDLELLRQETVASLQTLRGKRRL
ncbi:MAG TPA: hypothetical protein VMD97_06525 [Candidatus Aquilonibacter sp.]|nr:hypothetical protein [Candidatus Aquilonibacter sp.]